MSILPRYRSTGADLPFGNPLRAHRGVAMEGYFWRITDPGTGRADPQRTRASAARRPI